MKVVILAGGLGTRISEESHLRPKPMIEIGDQPILWHIMKLYSHYGFNDFIICAGYRQYIIKEYFADYFLHTSDITFDIKQNSIEVHDNHAEPWRVTVVDTGLNTMTGGRVKRIRSYVGDEHFLLTYGDGVSDVNISELAAFHQRSGKLATITAIQPGGRFGRLDMDERGAVNGFQEKRQEDGGFMALSPKVFDYIEGDGAILERAPFETLAAEGQMNAYKHDGFWQCMDTMRDKELLDRLWESGEAPWKVWRDD